MWSPPTVAALLSLCFVACLPAFEPDLGSNSLDATDVARCGAQGGPCYAAPADACEPDLFCDAGPGDPQLQAGDAAQQLGALALRVVLGLLLHG